jgi:hypothetical protein
MDIVAVAIYNYVGETGAGRDNLVFDVKTYYLSVFEFCTGSFYTNLNYVWRHIVL